MSPSRRTFLQTVIAVFALPATALFAQGNPEKQTQGIFHTLMDATAANNYDAFVSVCDDTMKAALAKTQLEAVSKQFAPRAKDGYDADYLGELNQRGFAVHLWRLRFKSGGDDVLATLSIKDGKAGGFYLK